MKSKTKTAIDINGCFFVAKYLKELIAIDVSYTKVVAQSRLIRHKR